ncbi:MAG: FHA domain-containing protein [Planctomycetia bacterium]|nr:FHA domain-containing protein [Planctomycetia bacterium]
MFGTLEPLRGGDDIPLLKPELTLGRSEKNDVVLRYGNVSGRHCRLVLSQGYWYVLDSGSTNGTTVNGYRTRDQRVDPNGRVAFAKHEYILRYDPVKNGARGAIPPETLESDVFEQSLLERAGVSKHVQSLPKTWELKRQEGATLEELESGKVDDRSGLTLDDLKFDD